MLAKAKRAFTTRRVPAEHMQTLITGETRPQIGDLVLARVEKIGSHAKLELPNGRRAHLSPGDTIIAAYGNRYAPDQFEAIISTTLEPCHLVAAGGIISTKLCKHDAMGSPTRVTPIGLIADRQGRRLNLASYAITFDSDPPSIPTVLVAGTAMNAGKTMTAASLVYAFAKAGYRVAGIKSTGTGAGGDLWFMSDMGAEVVLDFTDGGLPSTYLVAPEVIENTVLGLIGHASAKGCDVAIVEVADGLQHQETATVLRSPRIKQAARGIVFAANDALGAQAGLETLRSWGHDVLALSGQLTRSPLAIREASRATGMPVFTAAEVQAGSLTKYILNGASEIGHNSSARRLKQPLSGLSIHSAA
ncbi:MAG: hypothetical protein ACOYLQ_14860 [Hyphomicrobiaceae bacterium]